MPALSARVRVEFGEPAAAATRCAARPTRSRTEVRACAALGVEHLALCFDATDPAEIVARVERFEREVVPLV